MPKKNVPLKKSKSGLQIELFILNEQGRPITKRDDIAKHFKKIYTKTEVKTVVGTQMLEIASLPRVKVYNTALNLLRGLEEVMIH